MLFLFVLQFHAYINKYIDCIWFDLVLGKANTNYKNLTEKSKCSEGGFSGSMYEPNTLTKCVKKIKPYVARYEDGSKNSENIWKLFPEGRKPSPLPFPDIYQ